MTTNTDNDKTVTAVALAQLRAEQHATNATLERIATAIEQTLKEHAGQLRELERALMEARGVVKLVAWLGAPTACAVVFLLAKTAGH